MISNEPIIGWDGKPLPDDLQEEIRRLKGMGPGLPTDDMPEFDSSRKDIVRGKYAGGDNRVAPCLVDEPDAES